MLIMIIVLASKDCLGEISITYHLVGINTPPIAIRFGAGASPAAAAARLLRSLRSAHALLGIVAVLTQSNLLF